MHNKARFVAPVRNQVEIRMGTLDDTLEPTHVARQVWSFVCSLDTSAWFGQIQAVEGGPGRPASDPRVLLALWLYGLSEGVTSARYLTRLSVDHRAYVWLRGGVGVDYHLLADFRSEGAALLDEALTSMVVALVEAGIITLEELAIDGVRTRANAAADSFLTPEQVQQVRKLVQESREGGAGGAEQQSERRDRKQAAEARRQREQEERLAKAHARFQVIAQRRAESLRKKGDRGLTAQNLLDHNGWVADDQASTKDPADDEDQVSLFDDEDSDPDPAPGSEPAPDASPTDGGAGTSGASEAAGCADRKRNYTLRVSVTEPEAQVMKMGDGGFRPAHNVQNVTETTLGIVVDTFVGEYGSDQPYVKICMERQQHKYGRTPSRMLADGNYYSIENVALLETSGGMLYCPPPKGRKSTDRYAPSKKDTKQIAQWRARMGSTDSQTTYKKRARYAELTNARMRNNGLQQLRTRGRDRTRGEVLLHALTINMKVLRYKLPTEAPQGC